MRSWRPRIQVPACLALLLHLSGFWALARPLIVAHRGGAGDYPENTLLACEQALRNGADLLWLSVQLTRDGVPVLYRPADLAACTDGKGPVGDLDLDPVRRLNAGWQFQRVLPGRGTVHPYRQAVVPIPTLREALRRIPARVPLLLDLKSMPAAPLARAVAQVLDEERAWDRVRLYSTVAEHLRIVRSLHPAARLFEDRDTTRQRLVDVRLAQVCHPPPAGAWVGFELRRDLEVTERFTLGEGRSLVRRLPIQGRNRTIPVNRPPSPAGRGCPAARARIPPADSLSGTSWQQHHRERGVSPR